MAVEVLKLTFKGTWGMAFKSFNDFLSKIEKYGSIYLLFEYLTVFLYFEEIIYKGF